jgi:hypothetical protein
MIAAFVVLRRRFQLARTFRRQQKCLGLVRHALRSPRGRAMRLIAPPSFLLIRAAGILHAGSEAVDLATIAVLTDKNLRAAATTQKQSARHFIGACCACASVSFAASA